MGEEEKMKLAELMGIVSSIGLPRQMLSQWVRDGMEEDIKTPVYQETDENCEVKTWEVKTPPIVISPEEELRAAREDLTRVRKRCAEMERQHKEREQELTGEQVAWKKLLTMAIKTLDDAQMVPPVSCRTDAEWETMSETERLETWLTDLTGAIERGGKWER